jgi:hypothetical protein
MYQEEFLLSHCTSLVMVHGEKKSCTVVPTLDVLALE